MYCCSFFQLASRVATTWRMKASRSFSAGTAATEHAAQTARAATRRRLEDAMERPYQTQSWRGKFLEQALLPFTG